MRSALVLQDVLGGAVEVPAVGRESHARVVLEEREEQHASKCMSTEYEYMNTEDEYVCSNVKVQVRACISNTRKHYSEETKLGYTPRTEHSYSSERTVLIKCMLSDLE